MEIRNYAFQLLIFHKIIIILIWCTIGIIASYNIIRLDFNHHLDKVIRVIHRPGIFIDHPDIIMHDQVAIIIVSGNSIDTCRKYLRHPGNSHKFTVCIRACTPGDFQSAYYNFDK